MPHSFLSLSFLNKRLCWGLLGGNKKLELSRINMYFIRSTFTILYPLAVAIKSLPEAYLKKKTPWSYDINVYFIRITFVILYHLVVTIKSSPEVSLGEKMELWRIDMYFIRTTFVMLCHHVAVIKSYLMWFSVHDYTTCALNIQGFFLVGF